MEIWQETDERYKVKDQQGNEDEVIKYKPTIPLSLSTYNPNSGLASSQLKLEEYRLLSDGTHLIRDNHGDFLTAEPTAGGLPLRRFSIL